MAKSAEPSNGTVVLITFMFLAYSAYQWAEQNLLIIFGASGALLSAYIAYRYFRARSAKKLTAGRITLLTKKYKNESIAIKIIDQAFWEGQSTEQLIDSLGQPNAKDQRILKSKSQEVWKYSQTSKNQFSLKIQIENGKVTGWEQRS